MKFQPTNTRKMLEQRIDAIKEFLDKRLSLIVQVRKERGAELHWYDQEAKRLQEEKATLAEEHGSRTQRYQQVIDDCTQQIFEAEARRTLAASKILEEDRSYGIRSNDIGHELHLHVKSSDPLRSKWRQRLRLFQDGMVRRKRGELSKLERRLNEKKERAEIRLGRTKLTTSEIAMGLLPERISVGE